MLSSKDTFVEPSFEKARNSKIKMLTLELRWVDNFKADHEQESSTKPALMPIIVLLELEVVV